jgi:glycosyltransferase involved in cell wall biosynthesis
MHLEPVRTDVIEPQPLRVLMVLESDFTQKGGGGAESQLRTLALHLKRLGHHVSILTPMLPWGPQVAAEVCFGIPVARLRYPKRKLIGGGIMCLRFAAFLVGNRHRYDAWHVHIGHHLGAVACAVGALIGKPVVVKISGWWELEQGLLKPGLNPIQWLARRSLMHASAVQAISTRIAAELEKSGFPAERILVLPNAVDTERFTASTRQRASGEPFVAVFVGRLVAEKGLATLIDAWARAFAGRRDVKLRLVGGGREEEALREQAATLGITDHVEFLGHRDRVEEVLAQADVGILPSRIEGLSNTLLEFMACGLPVVASRVSGSEDFVVPGKNGWLFPVSDVETLAECLRQAESMPPAQLAALGRKARASVVKWAALDRVVGRLLELYHGARPAELSGAD